MPDLCGHCRPRQLVCSVRGLPNSNIVARADPSDMTPDRAFAISMACRGYGATDCQLLREGEIADSTWTLSAKTLALERAVSAHAAALSTVIPQAKR